MLKSVLFTTNCQFRPDYAVSPGQNLASCLEVRGTSQTKFASGCGCTPQPVGEMIDGMKFTDAETALLLNQRTGKKKRPPQGRTSGQRYSRWGGMCSVQHDRLNRQNDARGVFMASGQKRDAPGKRGVGPTILSLGGTQKLHYVLYKVKSESSAFTTGRDVFRDSQLPNQVTEPDRSKLTQPPCRK